MSTDPELFARVHDGLASAAERDAFDAEVARTPELAAEFALQRHIDARLTALFAVPATRDVTERTSALLAAAERRERARTWPRALALTAAAALLLAWSLDVPVRGARTHDGRSWTELYAALEREPLPSPEACTSWFARAPDVALPSELALDPACSAIPANDAGLAGARAFWITCGGRRSLLVVGERDATPHIVLTGGELVLDTRDVGRWRCQELARPNALGALAHLRENDAARR